MSGLNDTLEPKLSVMSVSRVLVNHPPPPLPDLITVADARRRIITLI